MSKPRYSIVKASRNDGFGKYSVFMFRDHNEESGDSDKSVNYGIKMCFYNNGLTSMRNAEDAITFCEYLNNMEENK